MVVDRPSDESFEEPSKEPSGEPGGDGGSVPCPLSSSHSSTTA